MPLPSSATDKFMESCKLILTWPPLGVLLCGLANALLYERGGQLFNGHLFPLLFCLIGLPILGGGLTHEKPHFTIAILTFGSILPLNDTPPISIGLAPFYWTWAALREGTQPTWATLMVVFPISLAFAIVAVAVMFVPYSILVLLGWAARLKLTKHYH
jgi:hypothetical protein